MSGPPSDALSYVAHVTTLLVNSRCPTHGTTDTRRAYVSCHVLSTTAVVPGIPVPVTGLQQYYNTTHVAQYNFTAEQRSYHARKSRTPQYGAVTAAAQGNHSSLVCDQPPQRRSALPHNLHIALAIPLRFRKRTNRAQRSTAAHDGTMLPLRLFHSRVLQYNNTC